MKTLIAVCLLLSPAMAQNAAPVQMESQSPSLTVSFSGQQGGFYKFKIVNQSSHAVTAFALLVAPPGVQKVDGRYACGGACSHSVTLADNAQPAIKAGAAVERGFAISSVNGGVVVAEAAIFDDESYDGDERAAAFLVAKQIGRQAEYDRLLAAVNAIIASGADDARKTTQIRSKLGELSVNLDPAMVQTFKRWFPDLAACVQPYARFMKAAASQERSFVADSMERFAHGAAPGRPTLGQWWATMQQQLAASGCSGCSSQAMRPKITTSAAVQNAAQGCAAESNPIIFFASAGDDSEGAATELNAEDMELAADLSEDDEAALDADVAPDTRPAAPVTAAMAAKKPVEPAPQPSAKVALPTPPAKRAATGPPSGIAYYPAPDGNGHLLWRMSFNREAADYVVYRAFFRDVDNLGDMALEEVVRWDVNGRLVETHGPQAGGLSDFQIAMLKRVAAQCNRQLAELGAKVDTLLRTSLAGYPGGWLVYAPPLPELEALNEQETATLNRAIARLRSQLGTNSFSRLDGFVGKVYRTGLWKTVPVKHSDDAVYAYFLHYFAMLDQIAVENPLAKKEAAKRQDELSKAGLEEKDRALLLKVALDFQKLTPVIPAVGAVNQAMTPATPAGTLTAIGSVQPMPAGSASPGLALPMPPQPGGAVQARAGLQTSGAVAGGGRLIGRPSPITPTERVLPGELEHRRDEAQLNLLSHIAQLRAGMSPATFQKLDGYLRELYKKAVWHKAVTMAARENAEATGK